jgi:hypothetical protein
MYASYCTIPDNELQLGKDRVPSYLLFARVSYRYQVELVFASQVPLIACAARIVVIIVAFRRAFILAPFAPL